MHQRTEQNRAHNVRHAKRRLADALPALRMLDLDKVVLYSLSSLIHTKRAEKTKCGKSTYFKPSKPFLP